MWMSSWGNTLPFSKENILNSNEKGDMEAMLNWKLTEYANILNGVKRDFKFSYNELQWAECYCEQLSRWRTMAHKRRIFHPSLIV